LSDPGDGEARWAPLGRALLDYHCGATEAELTVHTNLWEDEPTRVEEFYRPEEIELPEIERRALSLCRGKVLDVGAGAGRHVLELQRTGLEVVAVDVNRDAIEVMRDRGVRDARIGDIDAAGAEEYDTILLMMHGIGLVGDLEGLEAFLDRARRRLRPNGQILCDSADLQAVIPETWEEFGGHDTPEGRYLGEVTFRLSYGEMEGAPYPWLFVDAQTFERFAEAADFSFTVEARGARGAYLARLIRT
jgi:SAM-dependent methyltransferase